jgi:hypothetical protein
LIRNLKHLQIVVLVVIIVGMYHIIFQDLVLSLQVLVHKILLIIQNMNVVFKGQIYNIHVITHNQLFVPN